MKTIPFKVSARTARLIGRENVANAEAAIIELIKNSYDADAKQVDLIFLGGKLYLADDGSGMSEAVLTERWMTIGTDYKDENPRTGANRVSSGAKGIGRFALDKLGGAVSMYTLNEAVCLKWSIEWSQFNQRHKSVSDIQATLDEEKTAGFHSLCTSLNIKERTSGTIFCISSLHDIWDEARLDTLYKALQSLVPVIEQDTFTINLRSDVYPEKYGTIEPLIATDYDYQLKAKFDSTDMTVWYEITRDEFSQKFTSDRYADIFDEKGMGTFPYDKATLDKSKYENTISISSLMKGFDNEQVLAKLGSFTFQAYFAKNAEPNKNERETYPYRTVDYQKRMEWLKQFGGIRIYRDNFRVRPYGENGDDWLRLGERQAKSPQGPGQRLGAFRVRPNQISGSVRISRLSNEHLVDKSSREGIIENESFELLKSVLIRLLELLERDRNQLFYGIKQAHDKKDEIEKKKSEGKQAAANIKKGGSRHTEDDGKKAAEYIDILEEENRDKDEEIKIMRSLASAGLITAAAAHELKGFENYLKLRSGQLSRVIEKYITREQVADAIDANNPFVRIEEMADVDKKIIGWLNYALMPLKRDKRKRRIFTLSTYIADLTTTWQSIVEGRGIVIESDVVIDSRVKLHQIDLDTIFNNLIINSIEAFGRGSGKRKITITIGQEDQRACISYEDTGPGLHPSLRDNPEEIFLPQVTTKTDSAGNSIGTGMGMYLLQNVMDEMKGEVMLEKTEQGFRVKLYMGLIHDQK